jgi:hypothetical protein
VRCSGRRVACDIFVLQPGTPKAFAGGLPLQEPDETSVGTLGTIALPHYRRNTLYFTMATMALRPSCQLIFFPCS